METLQALAGLAFIALLIYKVFIVKEKYDDDKDDYNDWLHPSV